MDETAVLIRRVERERKARLQAESILEKKASELFLANERLREWNEKLEQQIKERTLELRESEAKYRSIIENMELGLIEVDNNDVITKAYERFCNMVGYSENELLGKRAIDIFLEEEYRPFIIEQNEKRKQGEASVYEVPMRVKEGKTIWVLISGAPIHNLEGEVVGSIGVHYDISEKKRLIEDLNKAKQIAEEAQIAEKEFLANMSHEIRTPLNAIIGMAHLLYDTQPTPEQREYLDVLKNSANFLHSLISNILDMSKIEAGQVSVTPKALDLAGLIRTQQKAFELKVEGKPIEVEALIDTRIEGWFQGDELLINQILNNLLGNAEKFTPKGTIGLSVRQLQKKGDEVLLQFQVYDTGIGISEKNLELIFDKFKQVHVGNQHKAQGTGLGLAIVKKLVELMGGSISVKSQLDEGTVFTFTLPLKRLSSAHAIPGVTAPVGATSPSSLAGMTLLVVEDNAMNRKYVGKLLDRWQVQYDYALNGKESLVLANRKKYDAILMDIQMPIMNGYEATLSIRNTHNPNQHTPIIALTASAMDNEKNHAFDVGMNNFLSKPFTPEQLQQVLGNFRGYRQLEEGATAIPAEDETRPLDTAYLDEIYGEDSEYAAEMFDTFLKDIVPIVESLSVSMGVDKLKYTLHKIRPALGMVGLTALQSQAEGLEKRCREGMDVGDLTEQLAAFLLQFRQKLSFVEEYGRLLTEAHMRSNR